MSRCTAASSPFSTAFHSFGLICGDRFRGRRPFRRGRLLSRCPRFPRPRGGLRLQRPRPTGLRERCRLLGGLREPLSGVEFLLSRGPSKAFLTVNVSAISVTVNVAVVEIFVSKALADGTARSTGEVMPSAASLSQKTWMYSAVRKGRTVSATAFSERLLRSASDSLFTDLLFAIVTAQTVSLAQVQALQAQSAPHLHSGVPAECGQLLQSHMLEPKWLRKWCACSVATLIAEWLDLW